MQTCTSILVTYYCSTVCAEYKKGMSKHLKGPKITSDPRGLTNRPRLPLPKRRQWCWLHKLFLRQGLTRFSLVRRVISCCTLNSTRASGESVEKWSSISCFFSRLSFSSSICVWRASNSSLCCRDCVCSWASSSLNTNMPQYGISGCKLCIYFS